VLGRLADAVGIEAVYRLCAFLPAIGILTAFLPDLEKTDGRSATSGQTPELGFVE
jgi:FSR family fosmidomycin resistance protein-like MFS transporter